MGWDLRDRRSGDAVLLRVKFSATELPGVVELESEPHRDARGSFARLYCPDEFAEAGLTFSSTQINLSRNGARHTLRGLHFQEPPYAEAKIVRAVSGSIFDVAVDLRPDSPMRYHWTSRILEAGRGNALFIPEGFAHGFLTLEPDTDVLYQMGRPYVPGRAKGLRYDDPGLAIAWPFPPRALSEADVQWPRLIPMKP